MTKKPFKDLKDREALTKECERLSADIRAIESANDKIIGIGVAIVGAGFAYGIKENVIEVFIYLPFALVGIFLYSGLQFHRLFWLGGYKRAVEEKINFLAKRSIFCWESHVEERRGRINIFNIGLALVYFGILFGTAFLSTAKVFNKFGQTVGILFFLILFLLIVMLVRGIVSLRFAYRESYKSAKEQLLH